MKNLDELVVSSDDESCLPSKVEIKTIDEIKPELPNRIYLLYHINTRHIVGGYTTYEQANSVRYKLEFDMLQSAKQKILADFASTDDRRECESLACEIRQLEHAEEMAIKSKYVCYKIGQYSIAKYGIINIPFNPTVNSVGESLMMGCSLS